MAFVNALFPNPKLIHGLQRSGAQPTTIVSNGSAEFRLNKLANYRITWKWPSRLIKAEDRKTIATFFSDTAQGGLYSFKFLDPDLNAWTGQSLVYTGTGNLFYLKSPIDNHPIFHPDASVQVRNGATPVSYTVKVINGVPVVDVPTFTSGLTIHGTFYFAARFNQPDISWSMAALDTSNRSVGDELSDLSLAEVFEHNHPTA